MKYWEAQDKGLVIISCHYKDDLLDAIAQVVKEADLRNGVLMTGVGSLTKAHFHVIASNNYPPGDEYIKLEGPLEITQIGGIIADGQPHIHITLFDKDHKAWGGHVEPGCEVLTLCELSIQRLENTQMTRRDLDGSTVKVLDPA